MNTKTIGSTFVALVLVVSALAGASTTYAAPQGNAYGYYGFPGNSLYGRMQNPNFMYKWGNEEFDNFNDLIAYIREYMNTWRELHQKNWKKNYGTSDLNVTTISATDVDEDSATIRGEVDLNNTDEADVWFEYGTRSTSLSRTTRTITIDDADTGTFSAHLTGLSDDTRYYYRAVAKDEDGKRDYGIILNFRTDSDGSGGDEQPDVTTRSTTDITDTNVTIGGKVDMNDFNNGYIFFVYGTDENDVEDVEDESRYSDIDEDGDNLQKEAVDSDLDGSATYELDINGLDENTEYFYRIGVEYEDEDGDEALIFGSVRSFTTDGSSSGDEEPDASTYSATGVTDEDATIRGRIEMNDFDNGIVFFVYGTDENDVEDVEDESRYSDIDEDGDNLQKLEVDSDLDGYGTFEYDLVNLDDNTEYFYRIGVEYEDEDGDDALILGSVRSFTTD